MKKAYLNFQMGFLIFKSFPIPEKRFIGYFFFNSQ